MNELTQRIALAEAMGWTGNGAGYWRKGSDVRTLEGEYADPDEGRGSSYPPLPNPLTDANDALAVVEMMREKGLNFACHQCTEKHINGQWSVSFFEHGKSVTDAKEKGHAYAPTLPIAICEAALRALGLWKEEV